MLFLFAMFLGCESLKAEMQLGDLDSDGVLDADDLDMGNDGRVDRKWWYPVEPPRGFEHYSCFAYRRRYPSIMCLPSDEQYEQSIP